MQKKPSDIHPELKNVALKIPRFSFSRRNLWLLRSLLRLMPGRSYPADIQIKNIFIPGQQGNTRIRLRLYLPKTSNPSTPALLWLHGGGYIMGVPEQDDYQCAQYASTLGICVVSVDYRLAPENPFPAGLEDSYSALSWVHAHADELAVDARQLAVGGESAGGGLAAALAQLAHDREEIELAFQLLVYPMLDDRTVLQPASDGHDYLMWDQKSNRFGWESYLGQLWGAGSLPPYAVPARRVDLSGLPPTWIGVGTLDLFHREATAYGQELRAAGVPCEIHTVPGAFHGFDVFDPELAIVQEFRQSQFAALRKYLVPQS